MNHHPTWNRLKSLAEKSRYRNLRSLIKNKERFAALNFEHQSIHLDCSKNWLDQTVLEELCELASVSGLSTKIEQLFAQQVVNHSEDQAAGHTALRDSKHRSHAHNLNTMFALADQIQSGAIKTAFGKKVKQLVNIGIGGSYLGPRLVIEALTDLQAHSRVSVHFIASVDDSLLEQMFQSIDLEHSLFCINSKSFGTAETLINAKTVIEKLSSLDHYQPSDNAGSLMAITANPQKAVELGIAESMILPFEKTIGGRFSLWSSTGFPIVLAAGKQAFTELLSGAESMDQHFRNTPFNRNMPVIMALLSIWYRNFIGLSAYACLPYDARLRCFPKWLQQLMMESNGKMHNNQGAVIDHPTTPWVFGDHGQLSQHAFFQAFHQGLDALPMDFVGVIEKGSDNQKFLLYNMIAQTAALMQGSQQEQEMHHCPGNKPSTTLLLKQMSPSAVGQLLSLYEHMIFTQSVIWNINCFDQPGVELGKKMANRIEQHVQHNTLQDLNLDPSSEQLIKQVNQP